MKRASLRILLILVLFASGGCATLFNPGMQRVDVSASDDANVAVEVSDSTRQYPSVLPAAIYAKPSTFSPLTVSVVDPCYEATRYTVPKTIDSSYFANIFNIHGLYIDALTGYMWEYQPLVKVPVQRVAAEECKLSAETRRSGGAVTFNAPVIILEQEFTHLVGIGLRKPLSTAELDNKGVAALDTIGFVFSYEYIVNSRLHFAATMISTSDYSYVDGDSTGGTYSGNIDTSLFFSTLGFRYSPTTGSGWFVGSGAGIIEIAQGYYSYGDTPNSSRVIDSHATIVPIFLDIGWQKRLKRGVITVNSEIDLERLRLSKNRYEESDLNFDKIESLAARNEAKDKFRRAGNSLGVNIVVSYGF